MFRLQHFAFLVLFYLGFNCRFARAHPEHANQCDLGVYQTPIHIETHLVQDIVMPGLELLGYGNFLAAPLTLYNNGHTVKLTSGSYATEGLYERPSVRGGLLAGEYELVSLHFHWATENNRGSEHVINGIRYPMEMHIVHRNKKYLTLDEAIDHRDGIVVVAIVFQLQVRDNRAFAEIVARLPAVTESGTSSSLARSFSLAGLLPRRTDEFFTYEGSLTTAPCSEAVTWFVFPEPVSLSFRQMAVFRRIAIHDNYRSLQPVGQRRIFFRRQTRFGATNKTAYNRMDVGSRMFWLKL